MANDKRQKGISLTRRLFEGANTGGSGPMPEALTNYTMEHLFGDVWQQDDLTV